MPDENTGADPATGEDTSTTDNAATDEKDLGEGGLKALQAERARAKALEAQLKELEPLAARARELEEANKTDAQRKDEALAAAQQAAADATTKLARFEIATAKGLPLDAVGLLSGSTTEEIEASADALLKLLEEKSKGERRPDPTLGRDGKQPPEDPDAWLRQMARS